LSSTIGFSFVDVVVADPVGVAVVDEADVVALGDVAAVSVAFAAVPVAFAAVSVAAADGVADSAAFMVAAATASTTSPTATIAAPTSISFCDIGCLLYYRFKFATVGILYRFRGQKTR
jgi:hypothetical protein